MYSNLNYHQEGDSQWYRLPLEVFTAPGLSETQEHLNNALTHMVHFEAGSWIR